MSGPSGNQLAICFPSNPDVSLDFVSKQTLWRTKLTDGFPLDLTFLISVSVQALKFFYLTREFYRFLS